MVFNLANGCCGWQISTSGSLRSGTISSLASLLGIGDEAEVHHVAQHVLVDLVGAAVFHVDVNGRIILQEPS